MNDTALIVNSTDVAVVVTSVAVIAGPKIREPVITAVLSETAFGDLVLRHELGDESSPRRVVERADDAEHERQGVDPLDRDVPREVEHRQRHGLEREQRSG